MALKRGDVVIVTHGEFGRPRPAVVVQADELGGQTTTVLVCPITSELADGSSIRPIVDATPENGLRIRSQIMTDKMLAVPRERVRLALGALAPRALGELDRSLLVVLGLLR